MISVRMKSPGWGGFFRGMELGAGDILFAVAPHRSFSRKPPTGAPEGTTWSGGPVDRFKVALRIFGDGLDPDNVSSLLGTMPTVAERRGHPVSYGRGTRIAKRGRWSLTLESKDCGELCDVDDAIRMLLAGLTSDLAIWAELTRTFSADVFCGVFMAASNRGFGISVETSKMLSDRSLDVGFDLYFDPPGGG
jgi:hypothetical protein